MCLFTTYSKNIMAYCDVVEDLFIWVFTVVVLRSIKPISFCDVTEITIVSVIFIL